MRFVVYGAGAVGGVVGGRLFQHGHEVTFIARGQQFESIRDHGLVVASPEGRVTLSVPVVDLPHRLGWRADDVVLLAVKSQDTAAALSALAVAAPSDVAVACLQNGVGNEPAAQRHFPHVYGVCVLCPTTYTEVGTVVAHSSPTTGILDVGRYPTGADDLAGAIARAFNTSTFSAEVVEDVMRWKYGKLLMNLSNAVEAICGPEARRSEIATLAHEEGIACLTAAGIAFASDEEDERRRGELLQVRPVDGKPRAGGSSFQSLARSTGSIETDYLNGEIVRLGRQHGIATPVNALLQTVANELAGRRSPPGTLTPTDLLARLPGSRTG